MRGGKDAEDRALAASSERSVLLRNSNNYHNMDGQGKVVGFAWIKACIVLVLVALLTVTLRFNAAAIDDSSQKNLDSALLMDSSNSLTKNSTRSFEPPLSTLSPMELGFPPFERAGWSAPNSIFGEYLKKTVLKTKKPLPTNRWYQNIITGDNPSDSSRIYSIPYVVDPVGPIAGIRLHFPRVVGLSTIVQTVFEPSYALTLGTVDSSNEVGKHYEVGNINNPSSVLMVKLVWPGKTGEYFMTAPIVRGMPYGTMHYAKGVIPAIAADLVPVSPPLVDQEHELRCDGSKLLVNKEIKVHFQTSDFTWLVFFSRPVHVQCYENGEYEANFAIRVSDEDMADGPITVRVALSDSCTTGSDQSHVFCNSFSDALKSNNTDLLRHHANIYPDESYVHYDFINKNHYMDPIQKAKLNYVWNAKDMTTVEEHLDEPNSSGLRTPLSKSKVTRKGLLMYALPHHIDQFQDKRKGSDLQVLDGHCLSLFHGTSCLVVGDQWEVVEDLGGLPSTVASRPPHHSVIPDMAKAIAKDILFTPPDNYMRGAGDTYFSGKILAKLARIIAITSELKGLAAYETDDIRKNETDLQQIVNACKLVDLPSDEDVQDAVERLKQGTEVWLNSTAESIMTYDTKWGGLVNCGCWFDEKTRSCGNRFPNCPCYDDAGMNFGNGFYNDHHFHYGYHIYAAAVVSKYDREWGKKYFQHVLMLIRDIANPSHNDDFFPVFRHKDWYLGSSWASGIITIGGRPYPNGRNQESSSESIAAYEAIALYGQVMLHVWSDEEVDEENGKTASHIRELGRLLTATELRSADRYWHVRTSPGAKRVYPKEYFPAVVGMLWSLMAQCQTWFGASPHLAYGIQLLPITPVTGVNYQVDWLKDMYHPFATDCESNPNCENQGWSLLQFAVLASLGYREQAVSRILALDDEVYESAGGNGHSKTNMLWFVSTRQVEKIDIGHVPTVEEIESSKVLDDCGCPDTCTSAALATDASGYTCKKRISWLMHTSNMKEEEACKKVGGEYPQECGLCDPTSCKYNNSSTTAPSEEYSSGDHPFQPETSESERLHLSINCGRPNTCTSAILNKDASGYTCGERIKWLINNNGLTESEACKTIGGAEYPDICGECNPSPSDGGGGDTADDHNKTPVDVVDGLCLPCNAQVKTQCPPFGIWFVCIEGRAKGGCSSAPWVGFGDNGTSDCTRCCKMSTFI